MTQAAAIAATFFCFGLPPFAPSPLDRQCIYTLDKFVNQINCNRQEWRSQETYFLGIVSACIEPMKSLSICYGLSKLQQIDLIKRIDPLTRHQMIFNPSKSTSPNRLAPIGARRKEGTSIKFGQSRGVFMSRKISRVEIEPFSSIGRARITSRQGIKLAE
jgi:hypothetical protein